MKRRILYNHLQSLDIVKDMKDDILNSLALMVYIMGQVLLIGIPIAIIVWILSIIF